MHPLLLRARARIRDATKPLSEAAVGALTIVLLRATRYFDPIKTANLFGWIARLVGPMLREERNCRANLTAAIQEMRAVNMGTLIPAGRDAPLKLAAALQNGQHVGMLVDQYLTNGVEVTFFGRKTKANPMLARLLRQIECPIHGMRIIRLPGHRFRGELSEEVKPVRDAAGQIDVQGTMQAVTSFVQGWIRAYLA